jgi:hypothetical protein
MCVNADWYIDNPYPTGWTAGPTDIGNSIVAILYKIAGASEPTSISVTQKDSGGTPSSASMCITVLEYSNIATTNPLDQSSANPDVASPVGSGNITTTQANELLVAVAGFAYDTDTSISSWSNSFTEQSSQIATAGALLRLGVATRIVSSTGTYSTAATAVNAANLFHVGLIASFKKA